MHVCSNVYFYNNMFSNQQCGFRKGYSTQHCLLIMLETWEKSVDKGRVFGALLTSLSKAFDCLEHELLTEKLNGYKFSLPALLLINDYLSSIKENKKWEYMVRCYIWCSILGPLLFNVFLNRFAFLL